MRVLSVRLHRLLARICSVKYARARHRPTKFGSNAVAFGCAHPQHYRRPCGPRLIRSKRTHLPSIYLYARVWFTRSTRGNGKQSTTGDQQIRGKLTTHCISPLDCSCRERWCICFGTSRGEVTIICRSDICLLKLTTLCLTPHSDARIKT